MADFDALALYRGDDDLSVADWQAAALLWLLLFRRRGDPRDVTRFYAADFGASARRVMAGEGEAGPWRLRLAREVIDLHRGAAWSGGGGDREIAARSATPQITFALGRLTRFARQVDAGEAGDADAVARRAGYYAEHAAVTFWAARRRRAQADGQTQERRVLGMTEHCPTCLEEAAKGWRSLGTLKAIGDSECLWRCACRFEFRTTNES